MTRLGWINLPLKLCIIISTVCSADVGSTVEDYSVKEFPLLMPHVKPKYAESYLCTSIRIDPTEEYYITGFRPNASMETTHHMLLYGCSEPGSSDEAYNCGAMVVKQPGMSSAPVCRKGSQVIFAWGRNASKLSLPEGVGFKVGGRTDVQFLVLQVHYASVDLFKDGSTDDSGVFIYHTRSPQPKIAGVLMLGTGGRISPQSVEYMDSACAIQEKKVIVPFAFRTHTHGLGRVVAGYKVTVNGYHMDWTLIGKKSPQLPQMFYPVANQMTITKGDIIAARCTMESDRNRVTRVGSTNKDEMCNFYMMYWTFNRDPLDQKYCFTPGPPTYYWQMEFPTIPNDASTLN